jgi:hypothetical protein
VAVTASDALGAATRSLREPYQELVETATVVHIAPTNAVARVEFGWIGFASPGHAQRLRHTRLEL